MNSFSQLVQFMISNYLVINITLRGDFLRSTDNLKKSSSWFWRLLSKSADLSKPWGRFFQILCVSPKVRTLLNYSNVVYLHFFPRGPRITESTNYRIFFVYISDFLRSCETNQPKNARKSTDKEETPLHCSVICNLWRFLHNPPKQKTKFTMAGISEFCAKIMIQFANEIEFLVENGKALHFTVVHRGIKSPRSQHQKHPN